MSVQAVDPSVAVPAGGRAIAPRAAAVVGLAAVYFWFNPYWWIDALIYATEIAVGPGPADAGHLFWRPAAWLVYRLLAVVHPAVDPLVALQLLSALGAGWLCVATHDLARAAGAGARAGVAAAALVAASQFLWAWGGSGSSYPVAAAAATASFTALLRRAEPLRARLLRAGALYVLAWGVWAVAALVLPGLMLAAYLGASGSRTSRARLAIGFGAAAGVAVLCVTAAAYLLAVPPAARDGLVAWVRSAGHGIPPSLSPIGVARAAYGAASMFLHLGTLGRAIKAGLLGGSIGEIGAAAALGMLVLGLLGALMALAVAGWVRPARAAGGRAFAAITITALAPVAAFAILWQGSDIERFSPVIGLVAAALARGIELPSGRAAALGRPLLWLACAGLLLANLASFVLPRRFGESAMTWQLGAAARANLPAGSAVIMTGQDLWGDVETAASYFHGIRAYNVHYNVSVYGPDVWRGAVCRLVLAALGEGARVAVLGDFLGEPTPGGIGLVTDEYPRPRLEEVGAFFDGWRETGRWRAGRFAFITIEPIASTEPCVVPPAERGLPPPGLQPPRRRAR